MDRVIHSIAGLPRAGSTLLCNILNQNPVALATSTSCLPGFARALSGVASSRLEFKNLMEKFPKQTPIRLESSTRAFCRTWHHHPDKTHVFDKSRGWTSAPDMFRDIFPRGVMFVCVRDLRAVLASIEFQDRKNGLLTTNPSTPGDRYAAHFGLNDPQNPGVVGGPLSAVIGLLDRNPENVFFVSYERLVRDPKGMMDAIYIAAGMEPFEHDFDNVPDTAIDCDGHYLGKYPHRASGKVEYKNAHWSENVSAVIAADIMARYPRYNHAFGYADPVAVEPTDTAKPDPADYDSQGTPNDPANYV